MKELRLHESIKVSIFSLQSWSLKAFKVGLRMASKSKVSEEREEPKAFTFMRKGLKSVLDSCRRKEKASMQLILASRSTPTIEPIPW